MRLLRSRAALAVLVTAAAPLAGCQDGCHDQRVAFILDEDTYQKLVTRYGSERLPKTECAAICKETSAAGGNGQGTGANAEDTWSECSLVTIDTPDYLGVGLLCEGEDCG